MNEPRRRQSSSRLCFINALLYAITVWTWKRRKACEVRRFIIYSLKIRVYSPYEFSVTKNNFGNRPAENRIFLADNSNVNAIRR